MTCMTTVGNDCIAIQHLHLHMAESAHAWLTSQPQGYIKNWKDLEELFVDNFQGTYDRPSNAWYMCLCIQNKDDALREYIKWFCRVKNSLPNVYMTAMSSPPSPPASTTEILLTESGAGTPNGS